MIYAENPKLDIIQFLKSPPLELVINKDEFALVIKNVSPVTLILSKRALSNMDILWFIKINGQRITSGVRGEMISDGEDPTSPVADLVGKIDENKEFIAIKPGETISIPIPNKAFVASGVMNVADSISESNPLDVTVSLSNPIASLRGENEGLEAFGGQLTIFSTPVKLDRLPALE